jgi:uncharacterized protein YtpQ (UPF0354 family)
MSDLPREPEAFCEHVASLLKRLQPGFSVDMVGPRELVINGRRLDLENLYRMVRHEPERGVEIVEHYLGQLFSGDTTQLGAMSFDFARARIMPRIQPESIFSHLSREMVAHTPFVNDTVVVFVIDLPQMTVSITTEQMIRWKVGAEDLDEIARQNLDEYAPQLEMQLVDSKEGGRAAILSQQDGYDAARLLMTGLYQRLAGQMGGDFFVALPARDMFLAISPKPTEFVSRLKARVENDFVRLPYPITRELFYVTRDGVAGTKPITEDDDLGYGGQHGQAA